MVDTFHPFQNTLFLTHSLSIYHVNRINWLCTTCLSQNYITHSFSISLLHKVRRLLMDFSYFISLYSYRLKANSKPQWDGWRAKFSFVHGKIMWWFYFDKCSSLEQLTNFWSCFGRFNECFCRQRHSLVWNVVLVRRVLFHSYFNKWLNSIRLRHRFDGNEDIEHKLLYVKRLLLHQSLSIIFIFFSLSFASKHNTRAPIWLSKGSSSFIQNYALFKPLLSVGMTSHFIWEVWLNGLSSELRKGWWLDGAAIQELMEFTFLISISNFSFLFGALFQWQIELFTISNIIRCSFQSQWKWKQSQ